MIRIFFLFLSMSTLSSCSKDDSMSEGDNPDFKVYFVMHYSIDGFGYTYSYYQDYMLHNDGTILYGIKEPYEEVDIMDFKTKNPTKVGTWEKTGDKITVRFGTKESVWDSWYEAFPAKKDEKLDAGYKSLGASTIRGAQFFTFRPDGTYLIENKTNETMQSGNYYLSGYGIYLTQDNGNKESYSFMFMPKNGKKDTKGLIIGGENWVLK